MPFTVQKHSQEIAGINSTDNRVIYAAQCN